MGGCTCSTAKTVVSRMQIQQALATAIEENDLQAVAELYSTFMQPEKSERQILKVDDGIISIQGYTLNALAYCIRLGHTSLAKYLITSAGCDIGSMYACYSLASKNPITILCEYGHLDLLTYFLPLHIDRLRTLQGGPMVSFQDQSESLSLFPEDHRTSEYIKKVLSAPIHSNSQLAIHRACEYGHFEIVQFVFEYFEQHAPTPYELNVHSEDEKTGENCALIATRTGNLQLMEYLLTVCCADFTKLTKNRENAIHLVVLAAKYRRNIDYLECLRFIVEQAKVNILYEYEEIVMLCEDAKLQEYIEMKLRAEGVEVNKAKIEEKYALNPSNVRSETASFKALDERIEALGTNFQMRTVFGKELLPSQPSSISPRSMTPFSMLSRVITS